MFVIPGVNSTWKLIDQGFYSKYLSKFGFDTLNWKFPGSILTMTLRATVRSKLDENEEISI